MTDDHFDTVLLSGASGRAYEFQVFGPESTPPAAGGVFVVTDHGCDFGTVGADDIRLIGRSANLSLTLAQVRSHARLDGLGSAWCFCARVEDQDREARNRIAIDLAASYQLSRQNNGSA
jgi:hypothetical protein